MSTDTPILFTFETPHTERDQLEIIKLIERLERAERGLAEARDEIKTTEDNAHGFKLCFPYASIGNMKPALFKGGSYYYYVPEGELDTLRAEVEAQKNAVQRNWNRYEREESEHTKCRARVAELEADIRALGKHIPVNPPSHAITD